jgi:lysophospholipase L1-like esterase
MLRVVLILFGVAFPLVALELSLRTFGPFLPGSYFTGEFQSPHPIYGRFHYPGFDGWFKTSKFTSRMTINSLGLRGPERGYAKPDDTRRMLFLGDSFIEALSVAERDGVVARVEQKLNAAGSRYETLNSGVAGWGQHQELTFLLNEGLLYQPDVVVVMLYLGNDLIDSSWEIKGRPRRPTEPFWVLDEKDTLNRLDIYPSRPNRGLIENSFLEHSMLWYVFKSSTLSRFTGRDGADEVDDGWKARFMMPFSTKETDEIDHAWQTTLALLNRIASEDDRHGIKTLVVVAPAMFQVYDDDWSRLLREGKMKQTDWSQDRPNHVLARNIDKINAPVLDLLPAFRAAVPASPPLYYTRDRHWTAAGHEVAAREIYACLRTLGRTE